MVNLDAEHFITADEHNFTLCARRLKNADDESKRQYDIVGYYGTMAAAINGYMNRRLRLYVAQPDMRSFNEFMEEWDKLKLKVLLMLEGA